MFAGSTLCPGSLVCLSCAPTLTSSSVAVSIRGAGAGGRCRGMEQRCPGAELGGGLLQRPVWNGGTWCSYRCSACCSSAQTKVRHVCELCLQ